MAGTGEHAITLGLGEDEMLGLRALAAVEGVTSTDHGLEVEAGLALRQGLADRLSNSGLPWAPSAGSVDEVLAARANGAAAAGAPSRPATWRHRLQPVALGGVAVAMVVLLVGGYGAGWRWTGFEDNNQFWDWLHLLLLPVAFAIFPLWFRYGEHMSDARKLLLAVLVVAFAGFVVAGYLVPITWTGFSGQTLWDWLTLIVLPLTLITARTWPKTARELRGTHLALMITLGVAWTVTLVGGYAAAWHWTGYEGNTLWEWLQLLLAPIAVSTVLVPAAARWLSGNVEARAKAAHEKAEAQAG
jgi:hypothetical protein